jgi:hypothetical protein
LRRRLGRRRFHRRGLHLAVALGNGAEHRSDGNGIAGLDGDLRKHARGWRRHFDRHFVGLKLDKRLIGSDRVAGLLEPLAHRRLGHGFSQCWNADLCGHDLSPLLPPAP